MAGFSDPSGSPVAGSPGPGRCNGMTPSRASHLALRRIELKLRPFRTFVSVTKVLIRLAPIAFPEIEVNTGDDQANLIPPRRAGFTCGAFCDRPLPQPD